jgi:hypothetical protein
MVSSASTELGTPPAVAAAATTLADRASLERQACRRWVGLVSVGS